MPSYECPGCGNLIPENEKCCKYCGGGNPNYVKPLFAPANTSSSGSTSTSNSANTSGKINWAIFIILLIVFWPGAVIYAIVASSGR